ncbi:MAG: protein kinase [Planctomycetes bacterium]|nr:protein kinase [Planctomycetota bacterium]
MTGAPHSRDFASASGGEDDAIDRLLADCLERIDRDGPPALEVFCKEHPASELEIRRRVAALQKLGLLGEAIRPDAPDRPERMGDFKILGELGRGGMGIVYLAEQISLARRIALKVLPGLAALDPTSVERFRREATTIARLRHPGIVEVHTVGEGQGSYYIAMELIEGQSLASALAEQRAAAPVRRSSVESTCKLVAAVADALSCAHAAGVIHRDVKPANILLRRDGSPVLTDFGLAREEALPSLTASGQFTGTPNYASPEQALGKQTIDARTDVYALGVVLYELLTLRLPFVGSSAKDVLDKVVRDEPSSPRKHAPDLPRDLETIVLKSLEKEPDRRYKSADAFAEDLRAFLAYRPIAASRGGVAHRCIKFARRHGKVLSIAFVASISLCILAIYHWLQPGVLVVTSPVAGADFIVDGVHRGKTDPQHALRIELTPGLHHVRFEKLDNDLTTTDEELWVGRGEERSLERVLPSLRGVLHVNSSPPGAAVEITPDEPRPEDPSKSTVHLNAPQLVDLHYGRYHAKFTLPGFETMERVVDVPRGGARVECTVEWKIGKLELKSATPGVRVELYKGREATGLPVRIVTTPLTEPISLPEGDYALRATVAGKMMTLREHSRAIQLSATTTNRIDLWLAPIETLADVALGGKITALECVDIDGDDIPETLAASSTGRLIAVAPDGHHIMDVSLGRRIDWMLVCDLDGDGQREIVIVVEGTDVIVYNRLGTQVGSARLDSAVSAAAAVANVQKAGSRIFFGLQNGDFVSYTFPSSCRRILQGSGWASSIQQFSLGPDSPPRVYVTFINGEAAAIDDDESVAWKISTRRNAIAVHRIRFDGPTSEIAVAHTRGWSLIRADGSIHLERPFDKGISDFGTVDLYHNNTDELMICAPTGELHVVRPDGEIVWKGEAMGGAQKWLYLAAEPGRGNDCILQGAMDHTIRSWSAAGSLNYHSGDLGGRVLALANGPRGVSGVRALAGLGGGRVAGLDDRGGEIFHFDVPGDVERIALGDADGCGVENIICSTNQGHVLWLRPRVDWITETPVGGSGKSLFARTGAGGAPEFLSISDPGIVSLTRADGTVTNEWHTNETWVVSALARPGGGRRPLLGVGSLGSHLFVIDENGSAAGNFELPLAPTRAVAADFEENGREIWILGSNNNKIAGIDASGKECFQAVLDENDITTSLAAGGTRLYVTTKQGNLYCIDKDGTIRWKHNYERAIAQAALMERGGGAPPMIVFIRGDSVVAADGDGNPVWEFTLGGDCRLLTICALANGSSQAVASSYNKQTVALDATGRPRWILESRTRAFGIEAAPNATNDGDGVILRLSGGPIQLIDANGAMLWSDASGSGAADAHLFDVDGDGNPEILELTSGGMLRIHRWNRADPRILGRRSFESALSAAERGDEAAASYHFDRAGFAWPGFDIFTLASLRPRIELLVNSPSAAAYRAKLQQFYPPAGAEWTAAIAPLAHAGRWELLDAVLQTRGATDGTPVPAERWAALASLWRGLVRSGGPAAETAAKILERIPSLPVRR